MKCFYCKVDIGEGSVVGMCYKCMYQIWGEKMSRAIISNMEKEKDKGNLELGRISELQRQESKIEEAMEISDKLAHELKEIEVQETLQKPEEDLSKDLIEPPISIKPDTPILN